MLATNCDYDRRVRTTYESKGIDDKGTNGMSEHAQAEDIHVGNCDEEIPEEVTSRQGLNHGDSTRVAIDTLLLIHVPAFVIGEHDPEREGIDGSTLDKRDHMDIPVQFLCPRQAVVLDRNHQVRDHRGNDDMNKVVDGGHNEDLVDVKRQGRERKVVGQRLHRLGQGRYRRNGKRVLHFD